MKQQVNIQVVVAEADAVRHGFLTDDFLSVGLTESSVRAISHCHTDGLSRRCTVTQTDCHTDGLSHRQTVRQIDRLSHRWTVTGQTVTQTSTDRQTVTQKNRLSHRRTVTQTDRLSHRQTVRQTDRLSHGWTVTGETARRYFPSTSDVFLQRLDLHNFR